MDDTADTKHMSLFVYIQFSTIHFFGLKLLKMLPYNIFVPPTWHGGTLHNLIIITSSCCLEYWLSTCVSSSFVSYYVASSHFDIIVAFSFTQAKNNAECEQYVCTIKKLPLLCWWFIKDKKNNIICCNFMKKARTSLFSFIISPNM